MRDRTIIQGARGSWGPQPDRYNSALNICNIDKCQKEASGRVGIELCERHIELAWAAHQVLMGVTVPEVAPEPGRDVQSLDARGTVYVVRVKDMIKIGWTSRPKQRMEALGADAILHYQAGTRRDEYKLQAKCMDHLVKGREWFDSSPAMIQFVKDLRQGKIAA
jgi:hypothetical protein